MKRHLHKYLIAAILTAASSALSAKDISARLAQMIEDSSVPSIAAAAIRDGEVVALGATGIRKIGDPKPVTIDDKYHIGSCTKSMTAVLAAMHVEAGQLQWGTTVADVFTDIYIHSEYRQATLEQLLTNTGGTPNEVPAALWATLWKARGSAMEQRMQLVERLLSIAPEATPGSKYIYSNAGFSIAGAMIERVSGKPYEALLAERLFEPLGMDSAGFRAPASLGLVDQPYGHSKRLLLTRAREPEPDGDNPRAIAPAGAVHCSVGDLLKYAQFHLEASKQSLIEEETMKKLHTPTEVHNYAKGWLVTDRPWAGGTALTHAGSNTMFYSVIWIAPEKNFAAVALCNFGGDEGFQKCDEAIGMMIDQFL